MHDEYKRLLRNPEQYSAKNHTFDDVLSLTRRFDLIEPFVSKRENDDVALTKFLGILGACGLGPITILNSLKPGEMKASYLAIVTRILQTRGVNMHVLLHLTVELFLPFQRQCIQSLVLRIKVLDESKIRNVEVA